MELRPNASSRLSLQANFRFKFPSLEATSSLQDLAYLQGLIEVVVITGFAEVGSS